MRFKNGLAKALTFSYDDGNHADRRLLDIFNSHSLKATFNLNAGTMLDKDNWRVSVDDIRKLYSGHEIACHCFYHGILNDMSETAIMYEVFKDREQLEKLTGGIVRGMAYPFGMLGGEAMQNAMKGCGIAYARTVTATRKFEIPGDMYRWNPTCHHNDGELMNLAKQFTETDPNEAPNRKNPQLFYVWGHSFEFDNHNNWNVIEDFADHISGKDDIWYATNGEIAECIESFRRLVYTLDGSRVYNPSANEVWININGKNVSIPSGKTVDISEIF